MTKSLKLLIIILGLIIISCSDNPAGGPQPPFIASVEPQGVSPGDIVTIYGSNLGYNPASGKIVINDIEIPFDKTQKWNNAFIRFQLPLGATSGQLYVINDIDTSNTMYIEVADKPLIEFIDIAPGDFMMGSDKGFGYEQPVHNVTISKAFRMSKYEITQKIWKLVTGYNSSPTVADDLPVMNVTWEEAVKFCNRLSQIYGYDTVYINNNGVYEYDTTAKGFRLPTEAEWEYACRAGTDTDFPGTGNVDDMAWYNGNSAYRPHTVGTKQPNDWGLYDMNGNVWEWCWDRYAADYYAFSPPTDPLGPDSGDRHVLRGGSCSDGATFARSTNRTFLATDFTNCGLRIVINK